MARDTRKRTASARDADDAPAEARRGSASAGPSGSARDAKAAKRRKAEKGKAPTVVEAVIDLDEEEDDDEFNEQNEADIAQMVRSRCVFLSCPASTENESATRARFVPGARDAHISTIETSRGCQHQTSTPTPYLNTNETRMQTHPQTQAYQTQVDAFDAQAVTTRVSAEERDALVAEVMRLMLFSQYRDGAPVQRADVSKLVSSHSQARGLTSWIVAQAQVKFMSIFGYEMKELTRVTAEKTGAARMALDAEPPKVYVLKSALPAAARQRWVDKPEDHAERGFCMTVCALVHMSGGTLLEDRLWQHLEAMGVRRDDEEHPKLGDAKAALARLVKRRYLIREKLRGATDEAGGDAYGVTLAERAVDEIGVDGVEKFVAGIMRGAEARDADDERPNDEEPREPEDALDPGSES